ncbi:MAG: NUDIX domain-containing protein [Patescibacteria group bacterium]
MEYIDIVNDLNQVIDRTTKEEINNKNNKYNHRIVHILMFNSQNKMTLHLRAAKLAFCPNCWTTPVGGYVQAGETYEQAALREYQEELGVISDIDRIYDDVYEDARGMKKFLRTYKTIYNGPFHINTKVVEKIDFFTIEQIQDMINNDEKFHPELLYLLTKHFGVRT